MKRTLIAIAALAATAAFATVTFNPDTGAGFVGKGDVQLVYGFNNAQMQAKATSTAFKYVTQESWTASCSWWTGPVNKRKEHTITKTKVYGMNVVIASDARKTGQYTGWNLNGFMGAPEITGGAVPIVGDVCKGDPDDNGKEPIGTYTEVSANPVLVTGGVYAIIDGVARQLTWPVPVVAPVL